MKNSNLPLKVGDKISIRLTGVTHAGDGVGRYRQLAVFVAGGMPGETVIARVSDIKRNYVRANLLEVTDPAPARRAPRCAHFSACGGCRLQHVDYREQLRLKTELVRDSLTRIAGLEKVGILSAIGMEHPWHYRNKAQFQVEIDAGRLSLGFYQEGSHRLTAFFTVNAGPVAGCLLMDKEINQIAATVEALLNRHGGRALKSGQGSRFFRHVMIRKGFYTGQVMVVLVTGEGNWPGQDAFAEEILSLHPGITSLIRNINHTPAGPLPGRDNRLLAGREYITDRLGELDFIISPSSFYQVNPAQTEVLYRKVLEYAGLEKLSAPVVVDAYSGIGTIALFMAHQAGRVYGLEVIPEAVEDARRNAVLNGISNAQFLPGAVEKQLPLLAAEGLRPDVVILDPPRSGCRPEALKAAADMNTPRIVYVSCDPGTLARDLARLSSRGYIVQEVQPVDMFPWTQHVECIVQIKRAESRMK